MQDKRFEEADKEMKKRKREISQAHKRTLEIDRIFKRIYEDDISGAVSHDRFLKLSAEYEAEQKELVLLIQSEQERVDTHEQSKSDFNRFAAIVRKYVGIKN